MLTDGVITIAHPEQSSGELKKKLLKLYIMFNLSHSKNTGLRGGVDDRALLCLAHLVSHLLIYQGS